MKRALKRLGLGFVGLVVVLVVVGLFVPRQWKVEKSIVITSVNRDGWLACASGRMSLAPM